jgi:hypothetical protein
MKKLISVVACAILSMAVYGQNVQTILYETWTSGSWITSLKQTNTYDGNGYLIKGLNETWDIASSSWKNNSQVNYTNNVNGTIQQYTSQSWDISTTSWINSQRATYTYNGSNKPLTITYESYTTGSWVNSLKQTNTYDGNGYLIKGLNETWDIASSSWKNNSQVNYTNNVDGTIQQYTSQSWDISTTSWINSQRATYTYNGSSKPLTTTYESYTTGSWVNSLKQTNTYDGNGYLINGLNETWDIASSSWKNNSQVNYTNNSNGTIQQYISQSWEIPTTAWKNSQRATYTYINSTGIFETNEFEFKIFPNPSTDKLNITLIGNAETKISITDLQGKVLFSKTCFCDETTIYVEALPSNIYFIILQRSNKASVNKFIKN